MESIDLSILNVIRNWLLVDSEVLLVTVSSTWGSSPRPIGAMMAVRSNGEIVGSVSGGCVEEDLVKKYCTQDLSHKNVSKLSYGVGQLDAQKFGLPCGGTLELILERVVNFNDLKPIIDALEDNLCLCRSTNIQTGISNYSEAGWHSTTNFQKSVLHRVFGPQWTMLIIGANDLAKHIGMLAKQLDYNVIVCDPRDIADLSWVDETFTYSRKMPDDEVAALSPPEKSIVLTVTHDPKIDDMALMQALQMDLFFVGAIGSVKTQYARKQRLRLLDLTEKQISKLYGPVGLSIGSKQPLEIAISILAQITQVRNQKRKFLDKAETLSKLA